MPVSFNHISPSLRLPLFWAEIDPSQAGTFQNYQRALILGYKTSAAPATANALVRVSSPDQAKVLFGRGSHGAAMFEAWFKNNTFDEVWGIAIAEPGAGTAATGSIDVTGTASASGVISLYIAGRRVQVNVTSGDLKTAIATAIAAAINANVDLPVTAAVVDDADDDTVALTAKTKGIDGNGIDVRVNYLGTVGGEALPSGVTLTITAMGSGAGNPDLASALAAIGDQEFDTVVIGWDDATTMTAIDTEWSHVGDVGRWSWLRQLFGHVYSAKDGTVGDLQTYGQGRNGAHITSFGYRGSPTPFWERAAIFAAQAHRALMADPARPLHTLPLVGMLPAIIAHRFTKGEKNGLAFDGISVCKETEDDTCVIETSLTMYQKNAHGLDDNAFLKVQTLATLAYVLRSLRFRIVQKFPRHKLANDDTRYGPGQAIVTPKVAKAAIVAHYRELEFLGLVENAEAFAANLIVERNVSDPNRLDVLYPPDLINQLDVFAVLAQFRLQYPARLPDQALPLL
ncbi:MAG: phage tail sheath C-terminal domain-containing protein [Hyphomicrobium sp.]|uniref:phage tail sheath C-terminal domain-containing protein n=1 Tax=Hyphomicrobium sp. TaxID=82 RepID=UPI003D0FDCCF